MNWIPGLSISEVRDVFVGHVSEVELAAATEIDVPELKDVHLTMLAQLTSFGSGTPWRKTRGFERFVVDPVTGQVTSQSSPVPPMLRIS